MKRTVLLLMIMIVGALAAGNDSDKKWDVPGAVVYRITDHQTIHRNVDCYIVLRDSPMAPVGISCARAN